MAERTTWQQRARRTSGPSHYQFGDATRMVFNGPWRQRAGRTEGPDHYQFGDVARMVINRTFNRDSPEEAQPILGDEVNSPSGSTTLDASVQASQMEAIVHAADEDTVVEVEQCSICMADIEGPGSVLRPCGHCFHGECIDRWLRSCVEVNSGRRLGREDLLRKLSCPNCRGCPVLGEAAEKALFPGDTLRQMDTERYASPENAYMHEMVRRVQRANETRDAAGRIRFFRQEDDAGARLGKSVMYVAMAAPAAGYFIVRRVLIPAALHAAEFTAEVAVAAGVQARDRLLLPLRDGGLHVLRIVRDHVLVPLRDGGLHMLRTARDQVVVPARDGAVRLLCAARDGGLFVLQLAHDKVLVPAMDATAWLLHQARVKVLEPLWHGSVATLCWARDASLPLLRASRDRVLVPLGEALQVLLRTVRDAVLVPAGRVLGHALATVGRAAIKSVGFVLRLTFYGALRLGVNALEVGCVLRDVLVTTLSQLTSAARVVLAPVARVGAAAVRELLAAARAVLHAAKWSAAAVVERALRPLAEHARAAIATLFEAALKPLLGAAVLALRTMSRLVEQAAAAMAAAGHHMGAAMAQAYADLAEVMREVYQWLAGGGKGR